MPDTGDVARRFGPRYAAKYGADMLPSHRRTLADLAACRTAELGWQTYRCNGCGRQHVCYAACRNRHCPKCSGSEREKWLLKRRGEMLPVPYFHFVFTVPKCLRAVFRKHQRVAYGLLMKAAAASILEMAADPRHLGAQVGVMAVLHTWTRAMLYHPHVHCLVPAGGLTKEGVWRSPKNPKILLPATALSALFRGKLMAMLREAVPDLYVPAKAWDQNWVVHGKMAQPNSDAALEYLGRYVNRVALTNNAIVAMDDETVTFRYKPNNAPWQTATLTGEAFLGRYLQHVLPQGLCKIRYYGLWHPSNRKRLRLAQLILCFFQRLAVPETVDPDDQARQAARPLTCPRCGSSDLTPLGRQPRSRAPPWIAALKYGVIPS